MLGAQCAEIQRGRSLGWGPATPARWGEGLRDAAGLPPPNAAPEHARARAVKDRETTTPVGAAAAGACLGTAEHEPCLSNSRWAA